MKISSNKLNIAVKLITFKNKYSYLKDSDNIEELKFYLDGLISMRKELTISDMFTDEEYHLTLKIAEHVYKDEYEKIPLNISFID